MAITQHNYEAYFIDYFEGSLTAAETSELMAFLAANPGLKREFDHYDATPLSPDHRITYNNKGSLKKSEQTEVGAEDEMAIARLEGDLPGEKSGLNVEKAELVALYRQTKLHPDEGITFPDPASLKKKVGIVFIPTAVQYAAAAIILLLISVGGWLVFNQDTNPERLHHDLAKLERVSPDLELNNGFPARLTLRDQETIQIQSVQREVVQLNRIKSNKPEMLSIPATLASSNMVMYSREIYLTPLNNDLEALAVNEEPKEKTLIGKIFSGMFGSIKAPFESDNTQSETGSSLGFSFWDIAELGVKGVNALGDHDYTVVRDYNNKGNVKGLIVVEEQLY